MPTNLTHLGEQAAARSHTATLRRVAKKLSPPPSGRTGKPPSLSRHWAQVLSVNADGTANLIMDNTEVDEIACLASYPATPGDTVLVDALGTDLVVIGPVNSTAQTPDVPVGGLLNSTKGTGGPTLITSATFYTWTALVYAGHSYLVYFDTYAGGAGTGTSPISYLWVSSDDGVLATVRAGPGATVAGAEFSAAKTTPYTPAATRTTTFSVGWISSTVALIGGVNVSSLMWRAS